MAKELYDSELDDRSWIRSITEDMIIDRNTSQILVKFKDKSLWIQKNLLDSYMRIPGWLLEQEKLKDMYNQK